MALRLVHDSPAPDGGADEEALAWLVRLTSGEESTEDHEAFRRWRDQSTDHAQALARARRLWTELDTLLPAAVRRQQRSVPRRIARILPIAASLILAVAITGQYPNVGRRYDIVTPKGQPQSLMLPDGSRAVLSGDAALDVNYAKGVRRIDLARGEALFQVKHDAARPFVVHVADGTLRDVGTAFDVTCTPKGARVVVSEGIVEVAVGDRRSLLNAGQTTTFGPGWRGHVQKSDPWVETAWTRGRLLIDDRPLGDILDALTIHSSERIVVLNRGVLRKRLSAAIDLRHVDDWLDALETGGVVKVTRIGGVTILT